MYYAQHGAETPVALTFLSNNPHVSREVALLLYDLKWEKSY